jgi:hypothetical protein
VLSRRGDRPGGRQVVDVSMQPHQSGEEIQALRDPAGRRLRTGVLDSVGNKRGNDIRVRGRDDGQRIGMEEHEERGFSLGGHDRFFIGCKYSGKGSLDLVTID